jgi:hypothetical protein
MPKEAIMIAARPLLRRLVQILAVAAVFTLPQVAFTQCAAIKEEGRWRNLNGSGDPYLIDVRMGGCGDQVLNGQQTGGSTGYKMRVWVKKSDGGLYGRPAVKTFYRTWKGKRWLRGNVSTGGYQDQMWLLAEERDGRPQLHVYIRHQSLDSKPSAQSEYWYVR